MKNTLPLFLFLLLIGCIEEYVPDNLKMEKILVVEGLITDEYTKHLVKLSYTYDSAQSDIEYVTNAVVSIYETGGIEYMLQEFSDGEYYTDSIAFRTGNTYSLSILTSEGKEYKSTSCRMSEVSEIDTVYYHISQVYDSESNKEIEGLEFYVDTKESGNKYLRYLYDEYWEHNAFYGATLKYYNDGTYVFEPVEHQTCWNSFSSGSINVASTLDHNGNSLTRHSTCFKDPSKSMRFNSNYFINLKQLSVSKDEFLFWKNLKESTENTGDFFGEQPYFISGNIKNQHDDNEKVIGYFSVSASVNYMVHIPSVQIFNLGLNLMGSSCTELRYVPFNSNSEKKSKYFSISRNGRIVGIAAEWMTEVGFWVAPVECVDCSLLADPERPDILDPFYKDE